MNSETGLCEPYNSWLAAIGGLLPGIGCYRIEIYETPFSYEESILPICIRLLYGQQAFFDITRHSHPDYDQQFILLRLKCMQRLLTQAGMQYCEAYMHQHHMLPPAMIQPCGFGSELEKVFPVLNDGEPFVYEPPNGWTPAWLIFHFCKDL